MDEDIDTIGLDFQHRQMLVERLHELEEQQSVLQREIKHIHNQLHALKVKEGRNSNDVFARLFKRMAHKMLDEEAYQSILKATQNRIGWAERQVEGEDR